MRRKSELRKHSLSTFIYISNFCLPSAKTGVQTSWTNQPNTCKTDIPKWDVWPKCYEQQSSEKRVCFQLTISLLTPVAKLFRRDFELRQFYLLVEITEASFEK